MAPTVPPTDAELDALIRARLRLIGIDLDQLPVSDPSAPADQTRVMSSLRQLPARHAEDDLRLPGHGP